MKSNPLAIAVLTLLFITNKSVNGQILDYQYLWQQENGWSELTNGQVLFSGSFDDDVSAAITVLPVTMGVEPHTSFFVSTNGFMTLSTAPAATNYDPLSQGISAPVIAPFATNLEGIDASSEVSYTIDNQGITVQWKNVRRVGYTGESFSFQARIVTEAYSGFGFGSISFAYGPFQGVTEPSTPIHVGLRVGTGDVAGSFSTRSVDSGGSWFPDAQGSSSSSTCLFPSNNSATGVPTEGIVQSWYLYSFYPGTNPDVSPLCNGTGNVVIYSNYDGGTLNINVDQDIPDLKIGICTYEPVLINITGPFVSNVSEVLYAGFNSNAQNNHCGLGNITTTISGVDPSITQILTAPPLNYETTHGNGQSGWGGFGGGSGLMVGVSGQCDTLYVAGGGNTPDEVVYYFLNAFDDDLLFHHTQYDCWLTEVYDISDGGNCCVNPLTPAWTIEVPNDTATCYNGELSLYLTENQNGVGPFTYEWTYNTVPVCTDASCTVPVTEDGEACVTVTNATGQQLSDCFDVSVDAPISLALTLSDTASCFPASFVLTNTTDPATFNAQEWIVDGEIYVNENPLTFIASQPGSFDVFLEVSTAIGCAYDTLLNNRLEVFPRPTANYMSEPGVLEADNTDVRLIDLSEGAIETWEWSISLPGQELASMDQNPEFSLPLGVGGSYPVQLEVTNVDGCTDVITGVLTVNELFNIFVPSSFTPNGDGINDVFQLRGTGYDATNFRIDIFNRWGEVIYSSKDPNQAWTGGVNESEYYAPNGVYGYYMNVGSLKSGERFEYTGYISIIR